MRQPASPRTRRQQAQRAALLHTAAEVFVEKGYEGASLDALMARVGGSKRTLYKAFGSKAGLFAALITEQVTQALEALTPGQLSGHDLPTALLAFGQRLMRMQMSPPVLALYRLVVAEGVRFPELARVFYDHGPGQASTRLAEVLEGACGRGELATADCRRVADHFVGMLRDNRHLQVVLGLQPPPGSKETEQLVHSAVAFFLDGVRSRH
jgi:AcrR family transcriptional regulator